MIREPNCDLRAAIEHNETGFVVEDILTVLAEVPGANDELHWHWVVEMKDGRFGYFDAWCDYTGWDCDSGITCFFLDTAASAVLLAPEVEIYSGRRVRYFLDGQVTGTSPFGYYSQEPNAQEGMELR